MRAALSFTTGWAGCSKPLERESSHHFAKGAPMEKRRREQLRRQKQQDKERRRLQRVAQKQTNRQDGKDSDPA